MSLEVNKAFAAVLTAGIAFMVSGVVAGLVVHPQRLEKSAIQIGEVQTQQTAAAPAAPAVEPITPLLANANADSGRQLAQRYCASCHSFEQGGAAKVGPNLYGIVGSNHAHAEGFNYSSGMKAKSGEPWTYEALNVFLQKPANGVPGTRMAFAGINQASQRADVIAFLRSISPNAPAP
jgi:cytochrome c